MNCSKAADFNYEEKETFSKHFHSLLTKMSIRPNSVSALSTAARISAG